MVTDLLPLGRLRPAHQNRSGTLPWHMKSPTAWSNLMTRNMSSTFQRSAKCFCPGSRNLFTEKASTGDQLLTPPGTVSFRSLCWMRQSSGYLSVDPTSLRPNCKFEATEGVATLEDDTLGIESRMQTERATVYGNSKKRGVQIQYQYVVRGELYDGCNPIAQCNDKYMVTRTEILLPSNSHAV